MECTVAFSIHKQTPSLQVEDFALRQAREAKHTLSHVELSISILPNYTIQVLRYESSSFRHGGKSKNMSIDNDRNRYGEKQQYNHEALWAAAYNQEFLDRALFRCYYRIASTKLKDSFGVSKNLDFALSRLRSHSAKSYNEDPLNKSHSNFLSITADAKSMTKDRQYNLANKSNERIAAANCLSFWCSQANGDVGGDWDRLDTQVSMEKSLEDSQRDLRKI
ncbi:predicted protein [Sclerotinia sclerotiorum 1980 UF-70]|uniref:Uncharacterized protein n=1 Tax=Sclerotinia sclerotiorum (strain ATCC 18683 / 1980 / Ss-1) TaxID=665079 RepID=A7EIM6_SCLS1|nr:predicted protein [Sclerotinia sclerotiorum 1980 UF-70]EDO02692.1 predicted protein [Sclerotinia sclerotiorum 1980 UF-70]